MIPRCFPPWLIMHIPHDATSIPENVRGQFLLTDAEIDEEIRQMTDHFTHALFAGDWGEASSAVVVRSPVSRLVVDVERFSVDAEEPMAARGMGAVYTATSTLSSLRRPLTDQERSALMQTWYYPHQRELENAVSDAITRYGQCLVIDCHSFPSLALPYERAEPHLIRPEICIGTDDFHTDPELTKAFVSAFRSEAWNTNINSPFAGALVPSSRYRQDKRVSAVMVEVNRCLYLDESDSTKLPEFGTVAQQMKHCCMSAISQWIGFKGR